MTLDFEAMLKTSEYSCLVLTCFAGQELEQQFTTALCARMLCQQEKARLRSLRCRSITEPRTGITAATSAATYCAHTMRN